MARNLVIAHQCWCPEARVKGVGVMGADSGRDEPTPSRDAIGKREAGGAGG